VLNSKQEFSFPTMERVTWQRVKTLQGTDRSPRQEKRRQLPGANCGVAAAAKQAECAGKALVMDSLRGSQPGAQRV